VREIPHERPQESDTRRDAERDEAGALLACESDDTGNRIVRDHDPGRAGKSGGARPGQCVVEQSTAAAYGHLAKSG